MKIEDLRAKQAPLKEMYRRDPQAAQTTMVVQGDLDLDNLVCRMTPGYGNAISAGLSRQTGGDGSLACSAELLLQALAGCAGVTFCAVTTALGLPIKKAVLKVSGDLDYRGTMGVSRDVPVGFQEIRVDFELDTTADDTSLAKALELTERYCVVAQSLKTPIHTSICRIAGGGLEH